MISEPLFCLSDVDDLIEYSKHRYHLPAFCDSPDFKPKVSWWVEPKVHREYVVQESFNSLLTERYLSRRPSDFHILDLKEGEWL